jgi:hypothetical protein
MYRTILWNKKGEIVSFKDYPSFEESLKNLNLEIDEYKHLPPVGAHIYVYLNPEANQSMRMIASLRTIR